MINLFRVFRLRMTLLSSQSFLGMSKIGETNCSFEGATATIADFESKVETSLEIEREREDESCPEDRVIKGGNLKNCSLRPN